MADAIAAVVRLRASAYEIEELWAALTLAPETIRKEIEALERAMAPRGIARAELRAAVAAFATRLRAEGQLPETALVAVKTLVACTPGADDAVVRSLLSEVGPWCIAAYFDEQAP